MREPVAPVGSGAAPDLVELAGIVARQRAELDRLREQAATAAVVERAKGVVMARTGGSADTAGEELLRRAEAGRRTLLEQCRITLGEGDSGDTTADSPAEPTLPDAPSRPAPALAQSRSPQELARCLLAHLGPELAADSVMIYARRDDGNLELLGHAGIDARLAARWRQVPPFDGAEVPDAPAAGEPRRPEDLAEDGTRCPPIGEPPGHGWSHAWLPLPGGDGPDIRVGVLRGRPGPFTPRERDRLREAVRLCAERRCGFTAPPEPAAGTLPDTLRALFAALPVPAMLLTPVRGPAGATEDFRVDAVTAPGADVLGGIGGDPAGRRLRELRPDLADTPVWRGCLAALAGGEPYESEPFGLQEMVDGVTEPATTYVVRVTRLRNSLVLVWVRHPSFDRQEQRLADLQRLGDLGWANWNPAGHEASWSPQVFAILGRDPADGPVGLTGLPGLAVPEDRPALSRAVDALLHDGVPLDAPFRVRGTRGVRHLRLAAELHGTPVEVHGFLQDLTARRRAELALVESERAILTQHDVLQAERTLLARLQNALLPLPQRAVDLAGLRVEVAYLPAQAGIHVGGDWFSAIELPDGDALFVVGDVAGHGVGAVATMAQLRFTAKGMVITGSSLTGALARLNTLLLHSRDSHGTATMVLARYEPARRRLVWAQAGHLPPLLLRDGEVTYLRRPRGMLLGGAASPHFEEAECRLEPGDRVLLYTDGLVERPPENIDVGLARLAAAVAAHPGDGNGFLGRLLETMLEGERRDDVCLLDIRVPGQR
ncbi:SpoIIE family protein phosphatase [Streptomyces sp. NPDC048584]|uniref:SpoIIE family protein phosphatase n=1 Tax=Streptomyces sp. NPDC048584 TaxID=3365573 RepID=UPI00371F5A4A